MIRLAERMGSIMMPRSHLQGALVRGAFRCLGLYPPARDYVATMKFKPKPRFVDGLVEGNSSSAAGPLVGSLFPQPLVEQPGRQPAAARRVAAGPSGNRGVRRGRGNGGNTEASRGIRGSGGVFLRPDSGMVQGVCFRHPHGSRCEPDPAGTGIPALPGSRHAAQARPVRCRVEAGAAPGGTRRDCQGTGVEPLIGSRSTDRLHR